MFIHWELLILVLVLINDGQGGWKKTMANSRPYMVLLERHWQNGNKAQCGGFLLNEDFVMTAAHCQGSFYTVILGLQNSPRGRKSNEVQRISVEATFPHRDYNATNKKNDIMLLKLSSKAKFSSNVRAIPLADQSNSSLPKSCSIFRWDKKDRTSPSDTLMEVNVTLIDSEQCAEDFFCSERDSGHVEGDCGGPLVCDGKAYGVVSNLHSGATETQMYAKIADHRSWIDSTMTNALKSWWKKTMANSRPYMVLLERHWQNGNKAQCGGFLLNEDFVMTAAHCRGSFYTVILGLQNSPRGRKSNEVQRISVEATFPHRDYNATNKKNDIMLLKLSSKAKFSSNVRAIPLADQSNSSLPKSCSIFRWDKKDRTSPSDTLMEVNVTLIDSEQCAEDFFCSERDSGHVEGDCGGPLVCDGKAYGVVSNFHSGTTETQMYAKIADHGSWIDSTMTNALKSTIFSVWHIKTKASA